MRYSSRVVRTRTPTTHTQSLQTPRTVNLFRGSPACPPRRQDGVAAAQASTTRASYSPSLCARSYPPLKIAFAETGGDDRQRVLGEPTTILRHPETALSRRHLYCNSLTVSRNVGRCPTPCGYIVLLSVRIILSLS